jgi:penicillin-binding protein 1A
VRTAHRLGIASTLEPNASIALGTSEVSVLELVSAYTPFANGGTAVMAHVVERVRTVHGKTLYSRSAPTLGRVVDARHVAMMNAMMRETLTSGTARKADLPGWPAAGKTGTSQDFRDAWFIGYTSQFVTGVWFGNDDASPTRKATGGGLPVEVWSRFMKAAHQGMPVTDLPLVSPGMASAGVTASTAPSPVASAAPPPAAGPGRGRDPIRPAEGTIDGWLINRLFPGR